MVKYLSGRQKLRPSDKLTEDRYQYLGLDQAEPNLADPATSPGVPSGLQYQLVAVTGYEGRRYWVPVGGSLQPGAITIFDEGTPVSSASSITQMNFVGAAVTANVSLQNPSGHPGIAATVTVIPVNVGDSPPNYPTPNEGELWWESDTGDLYIYYNDGSSAQWVMANAGGRGITGDKGEAGDKGQKGEVGLTGAQGAKGQKGEVGEKGAASTVAGPAGDKGQKGEIGAGQKGQKGEDGSDGDKGQKGEIGVGTKGDKGEGNTGGAQVTISDTAPTSPTPSNGDLWWESDTFDLHVYYEDGSSNQWVSITSNAALKGEKGEKGQKGEVGDKGQKGEIGDKGQKGEIGATGGTGGTGSKGQKGEVGATGAAGATAAKGQKGEVGAAGSSGSAGDKGSTGDKGDKGAPSTVAGDKGQKGEIGTAGDKGATGAGDKGQKGEEGPQGGGAPVGQIVAWSGSAGSLPSGYFLCDGSAVSRTTYAALFTIVGTTHGAGNGSSTFNLPDLRDRFVVGATNSTGDTTYPGVSPGATGGQADAVVVSHNHSASSSVTDPGHFHTTQDFVARSGYAEPRNFGVGTDGNANNTGNTNTKTTGISVSTSVNSQGVSGTNKNLPPYYSLAYIIQFAQGGTTAKGQKGEQGATGSGGSTGDKGQKGEAGDKGAASSVQGPTGDKGQKGEVGAQGSGGSAGSPGAKGQKGEVGAQGSGGSAGSDGDKGQKGEIGAGQKGQKGDTGSQGTGGDKGQKGEIGVGGSAGSDGSDGDKGQKGEPSTVKGQKGEAGDVNQKGVKGEPGGVMTQNNRTSAYTLTAADDGKLVTTNSNVTVPQNVFSVPDAVTIVNNSSSNISIIQASGVTLRLTGTTVTGNRTIAPYGMASIICVASNVFFISGGGLT